MGLSYADISAGPGDYPERKPHVPDAAFIVGYRSASRLSSTTIYVCRAGDLVVHQVGNPTDGSNSGAWNICVRNGGVVRIWRHANPSPYGAFVFQSSCNDHVIMTYKARAAQYVANRQFSLAVAWFLILGSIAGIAIQATKRH
jgi:hypothetical protein